MNKQISFLAYTDIHYHHYTNGITLADVEAVEDEMLQKAIDLKVDFILFGGDRYMSRNPMYEAAFASDRMLKKISDSGIPWFGLIGNHDRTTKNDFKLYTLKHIGMYGKDLSGLTVMDERQAYCFVANGCTVAIHAVPAGHAPDNFHVDKDIDFNICLFHAIILGSSYHNGTVAGDGLSVSLFDKNGFDLVLAGDNHKKQEIMGLTDCRGYYIGAPMQHNWGDEGDSRGFQHFTVEIHDTSHLDMESLIMKRWPFRCATDRTFIPSHTPKFMRVNWVTDDIEKLTFAATNGTSDWKNNIVKLSVSGPSDVLNDLDINLWKTKLKDISKARAVDIKLIYSVTPSTMPTETVVSDADEWRSFLATKQGGLDQIDTAYLEQLGMDYINAI